MNDFQRARRTLLIGAAMLHCSALWALAPNESPAKPAAKSSAGSVLILGDSLSAEYGIARGSGWVALLEGRLTREKVPATVINASISGETTAGGRSRLPGLLRQHHPTVVVIELGGNDALRGLPLSSTRDNLAAMIAECRLARARVVLVGMQVPPNYGPQYASGFAALFGQLAKTEKTAWVPFLLSGVADAPDADRLFQPDRIHPLAAAHPTMLDNVWPVLRPLLVNPRR